jgi:hypothetical protein
MIDPSQYLVQQFEIAGRCIGRAEHELQRLEGWLATHPAERLYDDDLDRACMHTARLIGAIARMQAQQVASALALARLGAAGEPKPRGPGGHGGRGPNGSTKSDANPMPRENPALLGRADPAPDSPVMPGLGPGIHDFPCRNKDVDGPACAGHDGG